MCESKEIIYFHQEKASLWFSQVSFYSLLICDVQWNYEMFIFMCVEIQSK
jgi:hypothetical protein